MELTSAHQELRDSVRGLVAARPDPLWPRLCKEIGVGSLAVDFSLLECQVVLAELGRRLTPTPMLGSAVLATHALLRVGATELLPSLCAGDRVAALTLASSPGVPFAGRVLDASAADVLLVADGDELSEFAIAEVSVRPCDMLDPSRPLATVSVGDAPARRLGSSPGLSAWLRDLACVALSAEQVGAAARAFELTHAYVQERVQFGRTIGSFQVIQHRLAEAYLRLETATTASWTAAEALVADSADAPTLAAMAKVHCSEAFQAIVAEMIQMHGGIAITWEHDAHRYLRRAYGDAQLFGAPATHLERLAATLLPT